jgi:HAMP domain-containing protein
MSIRQRIALLIVLAFFALAFIGAFAVHRSLGNASDVKTVTEGVVPSAIESVRLMAQLKDVHIATVAMVSASDATTIEQTQAELVKRRKDLTSGLQWQSERADNKVQKGLIEQANTDLQQYFESIEQTLAFKVAGQQELAEATMAATVDQYLRVMGEVTQALQVEKTRTKDEAITALNDGLQKTSVTLGGITLVAVLSLCVVGAVLYRQVVHPISGMQEKMTAIATSQDFSQRMEVGRKDEIGRSMAAFNTMIAKIQESTELVRQKTADVQAILHYVPQGIMSLQAGGMIHPEFSDHLKSILERDDLAGQDVMAVVFADSDLGDDARSQVETAISACIGEDEMNFTFNSHLLPTEINLTLPNGASKVLDLNWSPITDESGTTLRLLLCLRDVTEQRAVARAAEAQKRELTIIGEILGVRHEKFHEFIVGAEQFLTENRRIIDAHDARTGAAAKDAVALLYRNMHTIKGNARTHGLLGLTNVVHRSEQTYDDLRNGTGTWDGAQLLAELDEVSKVVGEYATINHDKLGRRGPGRRGNPDQFALVPRETVQRLIARLEDLPGASAATIESAMLETRAALRQFGTERVTDVLSGVVDSLPSLARELGKEPPVTRISDEDVVVRSQLSGTLRNVFMHLYRNALDHGIESTDDRKQAGKSPMGRIDLDVELTDDALRMVLRDDGRGLALQRIRRKAIERGMLDGAASPAASDLARLILEPGFSTADQVTEVSGRGVGMDAVRGFIEAEGGTLELVIKPEVSGQAEYAEFETVISLPRALAEQALT